MEMMKKLFTIIIYICAVTAQAQKPNNEALRKLQMAEFAITNLYVDKVDEDKLVEEAIIKMLAQLDPHSTYNNAEEVKKMNEPLQGNFEGIGVQFQMIEDTACDTTREQRTFREGGHPCRRPYRSRQ